MRRSLYCIPLLSMLLYGCIDFNFSPGRPYIPTEANGYEPVYAADDADPLLEVGIQDVRKTTTGGKIFVAGKKLFQVETGQGIHIIDYTDKQHPKKLSFLNIPGCGEVAMKGQLLYTNSHDELLVLDLSGYPDVAVKARKPGAFPEMGPHVPPVRGTYYTCPDPARRVLRWEHKTIKNPKCFN